MELEKLARLVSKGDVESFDEIFRLFSEKIYAFALQYFRSEEEAKEIVQEVFYSLWKYRDRIEPSKNFDSYLYTITFNAIRKRFRYFYRERIKLENISGEYDLNDNSLQIEAEYSELREIINKTVRELPDRQKEIYHLSREKGLSNQEIAQKLNITKKTVENHLNRALKQLKETLLKNGITGTLLFFLFVR